VSLKTILCAALMVGTLLGMPSRGAAQAKKPPTPHKKENVRPAQRASKAPQKKSTAVPTRNPAATTDSANVRNHPRIAMDQAPHGDDAAVGTTNDGKTVYEGARIGHYYVDDQGKKTYVKEFSGAQVFGRTPDGHIIYQDAYGSYFYYNNSGAKVYVKKPRQQ
jgi:hypothetical protein